MKLFSLLLASALIFPAQTFAQNRITQIPATCVTIETLAEILHEFDEEPAITMDSMREANNRTVTNKLVLFINYNNKTWTLAERMQRNRYCIIATGENINPYTPQQSKE
jgi:hypothetical protein